MTNQRLAPLLCKRQSRRRPLPVKREQLAWALVALMNLLALVILAIGLAPLDGYAITFTWPIILTLALATLAIAGVFLWLITR